MKILIVEDSALVVESVSLAFQLQWADVEIVSSAGGGKAIDLVESERPDLVLLDVGLPDIDGYKVLEAIREFSDIPVIMLTARDETMDKVKGLELGADDYVTKPFDHLELLARIRSVLRRLDMPAPRSRIPSLKSGDLEVDFQVQEARLSGERLDLTPTEYKLLYHLVRNAGRILTHETLLSRVWGREYSNELDYLRVYIRRLRDKLKDDPTHPTYIRTERGTGYRFIAPPPSDTRPQSPEVANGPSPPPPKAESRAGHGSANER
jgi:DNA-binding response OmpR family regulator